MCDDAVCKDTWLLEYVPDWFKAQGLCERAVKEDCDYLIHVRDWFVVAQEIAVYRLLTCCGSRTLGL